MISDTHVQHKLSPTVLLRGGTSMVLPGPCHSHLHMAAFCAAGRPPGESTHTQPRPLNETALHLGNVGINRPGTSAVFSFFCLSLRTANQLCPMLCLSVFGQFYHSWLPVTLSPGHIHTLACVSISQPHAHPSTIQATRMGQVPSRFSCQPHPLKPAVHPHLPRGL